MLLNRQVPAAVRYVVVIELTLKVASVRPAEFNSIPTVPEDVPELPVHHL